MTRFQSRKKKPFISECSRTVPRTFFYIFWLGLADSCSMLSHVSRPERHKGPDFCLLFLQDAVHQQGPKDRWTFCFPLCELSNTPHTITGVRKECGYFAVTSHLKVKDHEEADPLFNSRTTGPKDPHTTIGRNYSATEIALYNDRIRKKMHVFCFSQVSSHLFLKLLKLSNKTSKMIHINHLRCYA